MLNDVAVAVRVLRRDRLARRVAVVDLDVHQGNGTAHIFEGDEEVFTFSMHGAKNYPLFKLRSSLDVELVDGTTDEEYLEALARHLPRVFAHAPELVFYLGGADPYAGDKLGRLSLSIAGLARARRAGAGRMPRARRARRNRHVGRLRRRHQRHGRDTLQHHPRGEGNFRAVEARNSTASGSERVVAPR